MRVGEERVQFPLTYEVRRRDGGSLKNNMTLCVNERARAGVEDSLSLFGEWRRTESRYEERD